MSEHEPQTPSETEQKDRRPRTGPIVWGVLILVFCAFVVQQTFAPGTVHATTWLIGAVISLGMLLLVVGFAVILRNRG